MLSNVNEMVAIDHDKYILSPDKDLMVRSLSVDDTGLYFCIQSGESEAVYQVDVVKVERRLQVG